MQSEFHIFIGWRISKLVRSRHRELETYLDLYYMDSTNNRLFQMNYKNKEMGERDFLQLVSILLFGRTDEDIRSVKKMIKLHSLIQRSFYKKWLIRILKFLQVFPGVYMKDKISLYYPRSIPFKSTFFKNPVTFLHPVTGEKQETSVVRIEDKCIGDTLSIFGALEDNWGKKDVFDVLFMFPAPNLHTGMVDTTTDDMLFFDTSKKIEELLL